MGCQTFPAAASTHLLLVWRSSGWSLYWDQEEFPTLCPEKIWLCFMRIFFCITARSAVWARLRWVDMILIWVLKSYHFDISLLYSQLTDFKKQTSSNIFVCHCAPLLSPSPQTPTGFSARPAVPVIFKKNICLQFAARAPRRDVQGSLQVSQTGGKMKCFFECSCNDLHQKKKTHLVCNIFCPEFN